jgi:hypothetical protein
VATPRDHPLLIDGEPVETGDWLEVRSPFSGEIAATIPIGSRSVSASLPSPATDAPIGTVSPVSRRASTAANV